MLLFSAQECKRGVHRIAHQVFQRGFRVGDLESLAFLSKSRTHPSLSFLSTLPILAEDLLHRGIRPADYDIVQRQLRPSATSCYCVDFGASTGDLRPYQATTVCDCFLARVGTELGQAFRTWGTLGSLYIASRCFVAVLSEGWAGNFSFRSRPQPAPRHPPVSVPLVSPRLARLPARQQRGLTAHEWPSAPRPLLSPFSWHRRPYIPRIVARALPAPVI
jgi:hypothetical protein